MVDPGRDGKFLTSRQIRERLLREASHNVALRVEDTENPERFKVSGRGELHLSILIETMRREGYELAISRPEVILHETESGMEEPYETLVVDLESDYQGAVMERLGERRGELQNMQLDGKGRVRLDYIIPARGLIGLRSRMLTATAWLPEHPLISLTIGRKTASVITAARVSVYSAITLAAIMFSTMFKLSQDRRRPARECRGIVRNSSPPTIPLNLKNFFVFCLLTASLTASGNTNPTIRLLSFTTGTPNK